MLSPDAALWNAFLAGDKQAFERIFLAYYDPLYAYGVRLTADAELVKDSIQNLFQRLWQRRQVLGAIDEIKPYLFRALRNHVADELRARQRRRALQHDYPAEFEVQYSAEDLLIAQQLTAEQHARLRVALDQLSSRHREAILLKFFDGFSYDRIAEIMALNPQSVRNLIHQVIKRLRQTLLLLALTSGLPFSQKPDSENFNSLSTNNIFWALEKSFTE